MPKRKLLLFTKSFPGDGAESVFVSKELPFLQRKFDVQVLTWSDHLDGVEGTPYLMTFLLAFLKGPFNWKVLNNLRYEWSRIKLMAKVLHSIEDQVLALPSDAILYTYWWDQWNVVLSVLKKKHRLKNLLVSRVHGFDVYDERNRYGVIPFRRFQVEMTDHVYSVSGAGYEYLKKRYPSLSISIARLGTFDHGEGPKDSRVLTVVSCSRLVEIKRVDRILDMLRSVDKPVKWIHLGDGPLKEELRVQSKKLPSHVSVEWQGELSNDEVIKFYQSTPVDWFINSSDSEGVPMSIMEAISFGIPVIATDVGGNGEVVDSEIGYLVKPSDFRESASKYINGEEQIDRTVIKDFWKNRYNADLNYDKFMNELFSILRKNWRE